MDQGVNLPFNAYDYDLVSFGFPLWVEEWTKVIVTGSKPVALRNSQDGGRLVLSIKAIEGANAGKEHIIGLNIWHADANTKQRAYNEMATIALVAGKPQFNNTAELYNLPFYVLPVTTTGQPTPQYPNPQPQTNFRGYKHLDGRDPQMQGGGTGAPAGGPPANFGGGGGQSQQQGGFNPGAGAGPQFGNQPAGPGGFNPNPNPGNPNPNPGNPNGGWPGSGAPSGAGAPFQPNAGTTGFPGGPNGATAQSPFGPNAQQGGGAAPWGPQGGSPGGFNPNPNPGAGGGGGGFNPNAGGGGWPPR